jgi:hypothetical protein
MLLIYGVLLNVGGLLLIFSRAFWYCIFLSHGKSKSLTKSPLPPFLPVLKRLIRNSTVLPPSAQHLSNFQQVFPATASSPSCDYIRRKSVGIVQLSQSSEIAFTSSPILQETFCQPKKIRHPDRGRITRQAVLDVLMDRRADHSQWERRCRSSVRIISCLERSVLWIYWFFFCDGRNIPESRLQSR